MGSTTPTIRTESHYGDRVVPCFHPRPPHVWAMFDAACARNADGEALVANSQRWTYAQANAFVLQLAAGMAEAGIGTGDRVAMLLSNRAEFFFVYFAIMRLGAIAVPIGTREQADGVSFMLAQCSARAIVFDDAFAAAVAPDDPPGLPTKLLRISCDSPDIPPAPGARPLTTLATSTAALPVFVQPREEDCATLLYTSGTTGRPKGAMITHLGIVHSALHFRFGAGLDEGVRAMLAVPASHVTGLVAIMLTAVACIGTTVILPTFTASGFLEQAARERISYTVMVPAMYKLCLLQADFSRHDLSAWAVGGYGGAPMPVITIDELATRLPQLQLINAYGATETTSPATIMPSQSTRKHADSVGKTVACGAIVVMDDDGRELPAGEIGELWIAGPMVVRGYWNNPEADAREFTAGWWHSGDLGSIDHNGFVRVLDRKKDMINRGGYKIFSVEVENRLMACDGVIEAAVVGLPCPVLGERVHAFVVTNDGQGDPETLRQWCAQTLADYKVPETIRLSGQPLPRNTNGKVLKRELRSQLRADTEERPVRDGRSAST